MINSLCCSFSLFQCKLPHLGPFYTSWDSNWSGNAWADYCFHVEKCVLIELRLWCCYHNYWMQVLTKWAHGIQPQSLCLFELNCITEELYHKMFNEFTVCVKTGLNHQFSWLSQLMCTITTPLCRQKGYLTIDGYSKVAMHV